MTKITTKRHPLKFYTLVIFGTLFLCAIGTFLVFTSIDILQNEHPPTKAYLMLFWSLSSYLIAFSMVYSYWKNSPKVSIDKYDIRIGSQSFYIKDIKNVTLTGKRPFRFIIQHPKEATTIHFNDGTKKILFDEMYSNSHELKSFLEQVVIKKQDYKPTLTNQTYNVIFQIDNEEIFKGNQFTSMRGISLWALICCFAYTPFSNTQNPPLAFLLFLGAFGTFWFVLNSWLMHYFSLANDYLIVRNHNFIWKKKTYRFSDIKEVVFETQGKMPNCLRVITKDFRNKLYPAGTLRDKTWLDLKDKLEARNVTVRNECI